MSNFHVIVLAAGQGSRMRSSLPKVLHEVGGKPMLAHVIDAGGAIQPAKTHIVFGHGGALVRERFANTKLNWVEQAEQLGTGHAVKQVAEAFADSEAVLVLYGDVPLVTAEVIQALAAALKDASVAVLSTELSDATGYGRIVRRANGEFIGIVEHKDATAEQLRITEVNTGLMAFRADAFRLISLITNDNAQQEYYLTDLVSLAVAHGLQVAAVKTDDYESVAGVNNRAQQAAAERVWQARQVEKLMEQGVTVVDPTRLDIRGDVTIGRDVKIDVNVVLSGSVTLADNVTVGANCILNDCRIEAGAEVKPFSHIDGAEVGSAAVIGPYARLREGTKLAAGAKIGNFVETKKAVIGVGSKVNHLSYIGDAEIGSEVNIGAGTITCNYDGVNKHQTEIGDGAFIGSGTQLVAPVTVGEGATVGAGTTLRKNAPAEQLTLTKGRHQTVEGWQRPTKLGK